jgi:type IV pilus assembly protein PilB
MPVSEATQQIIMSGGNQLDIEKQARKEGVFDLRVAALNKARQGITSLEEVERVTNL